jgi:hypothetical protein
MLKKVVQQGRSEAHGAMRKERHVCARRRDGEPAVSQARRHHFSPTAPSCFAALSRWYVEPLSDARTPLANFFSILWAKEDLWATKMIWNNIDRNSLHR